MLVSLRRKLAAFLAVVMLASCFVVVGAPKAYADSAKVVKYAKTVKISTGSPEIYFDMSNKVKKIKKVKVTSSNKSVLKVVDSAFLEVKKAGTSTLTIKVTDKSGHVHKYKSTVKVYKYKNAFKSFKIGKKQLRTKFKKYTNAWFDYGKLKSGKINITPASGWKLVSIKYEAYIGDKHYKKTIKNKSKINLDKNGDYEITVKMKNKKTGLKEEYIVMYENYDYDY